ncbi:MAG: LacI family DNA-binding transcriptional regulator [Vibrio sp.]
MATIMDVCKLAGVSKATVSRVMNQSEQVKPTTRQKVEQAMAQLNYRPNSLAQALALNSSNSIGLVLSDFDGHYFGQLLKHASICAENMDKQLLIADGHHSAQGEKDAISSLVDKKCDVIIVYGRKLSQDDAFALKQNHPIPIIHVGRLFPAEIGFSIGFDQSSAVELALSHLTSLGHTSISYLGPKPHTMTTQARLESYCHFMQINHLSAHVLDADFKLNSGYQSMLNFLNQTPKKATYPTAILAASDDIAIGCLRACDEFGLNVPFDISVISIDNLQMCEFVRPQLSSIDIPVIQMTERVMQVAQMILQGAPTPDPEMLTGQLFVRHSTAPAKSNKA